MNAQLPLKVTNVITVTRVTINLVKEKGPGNEPGSLNIRKNLE